MFSFFKSKNITPKDTRIEDSQKMLIDAARETTQLAIDVANVLRAKSIDTEKQLWSTSNLVQDAIIVTNSDLKILNANNAACRMLAKIEPLLIDTLLTEYFDFDSSTSILDIKHCIKSSRPVKLKSDESISIRSDYTIAPKLSGDNSYIFLFKDITLEEQIEEIKIKYDALKNNSPSAIFVLDNRFQIIESNEEARNILKYYDIEFNKKFLSAKTHKFAGKSYDLYHSQIDHLGKICFVVFLTTCKC